MPISWRLGRKRPGRVLAHFAQVEADSGWQFLRAIDKIDKPETRAMLFHHLLEEAEHASLFRDLADSLPGGERGAPAQRTSLVDDGRGLAEFLAYVHAGELDIAQEFEAYAKASSVPRAAKLFDEIAIEEAGHHSTLFLALLDVVSKAEAETLVHGARRRRAWTAWLGFWHGVGDTMIGGWLGLAYFLLGPFLFVSSSRRIAEAGDRDE